MPGTAIRTCATLLSSESQFKSGRAIIERMTQMKTGNSARRYPRPVWCRCADSGRSQPPENTEGKGFSTCWAFSHAAENSAPLQLPTISLLSNRYQLCGSSAGNQSAHWLIAALILREFVAYYRSRH